MIRIENSKINDFSFVKIWSTIYWDISQHTHTNERMNERTDLIVSLPRQRHVNESEIFWSRRLIWNPQLVRQPFGALMTLLVGWDEGHPACKNLAQDPQGPGLTWSDLRKNRLVIYTGWYLPGGGGGTRPGHWVSGYGTKWPISCWCATATRPRPPHGLYLQIPAWLYNNWK